MSCARASSWIWSRLDSWSCKSLSCSCLIRIFCSMESLCRDRSSESSSLSSSIVFRRPCCSFRVLSSAAIMSLMALSSPVSEASDESATSACFLIFPGSPRTFIISARWSSTSTDNTLMSATSEPQRSSSAAFSVRSFSACFEPSSMSAVSCSMCRFSASKRGRSASIASRSLSSFSCVISSFCRSSSATSSISIASLSSHSTTSASAFANSVRVCSSSSLISLSLPPSSSAEVRSFRKSSLRSLAFLNKFFSFSYVCSTTSCSFAYLLL
mmetsp:Transcript_40290/g.95678  ORF Transcript_40290/g.95678 Transcript_40290/m.95678 type:complete len:270 (+) Transcript_40290:2047-2856(+)